MSSDASVSVIDRLDGAVVRGRAIKFCDESPDNEYPEISWQIFGLTDTNEIAVVARCGELRIGICRESGLLYPAMADRMFGIDVADQQLAMQLSDKLWNEASERLTNEARRLRVIKS